MIPVFYQTVLYDRISLVSQKQQKSFVEYHAWSHSEQEGKHSITLCIYGCLISNPSPGGVDETSLLINVYGITNSLFLGGEKLFFILVRIGFSSHVTLGEIFSNLKWLIVSREIFYFPSNFYYIFLASLVSTLLFSGVSIS